MLRQTVSRFAQVSKTANPAASVQQLADLPTSTGAGLFVENAKFEPLGTPPTLLHVSLPASATLNARTRSLSALNGDSSAISQKLRVMNLWQKPLMYNEITSTKPLSLLLSHSQGFVNLELQKGDQWTVMNTDDVAGWYGHLNLSVISSIRSGLKVAAQDRGNLILTGKSQVFTIQLEQGETISVSPGSIVAYTGEPVGFVKLKSLELPTFGMWNTVKFYYSSAVVKVQSLMTPEVTKESPQEQNDIPLAEESTGKELVEVKEPTVIENVKDWASTKFNTAFLKNRLFYELQGPATIIIQNEFQSPSKAFTQKELLEIYKSLK